MMRLPDDITVVIAAKREAPSIAAVVRACRRYASTVLVVADRQDDDGTAQAAANAGARVLVDEGRGKGHAIRLGIAEVRTPIVVFVDADGSHDPDDIPRLVGPILSDTADHVSASRITGGSSEMHGGFDEFLRLAGSSFITACINRRFGVRLSDSQNGFRAIRTDVVRSLGLTSNITTIEQEMIMRSLERGYRVSEIPSHEHRRLAGQSHINVRRVAFAYVCNLIRHVALTRYSGARPAAATVERESPVSQLTP